ncbi:tetratricopeptide repeat protein [Flavobacterium lindanitolerans]|uniref:Tetratricopeptide repeat protein n=1 Tax=Flavobacterium lindanitolerans TaxID=428988 RepID=A0A497U777_9FLAO|nr:tetratricopeptide repeat protein [Flavobacterium lindanitolerans]MBC8645170.1 tetratricopeptide repeat protein [Flavobacterium lindanitolerans]PKW29868.1 tetratricopeptide repeat protein [Flavobacterium lindanitolerans]RLJ24208.1 tetratricopeptide repeat protein [Flavobacterium lindanitolerans]
MKKTIFQALFLMLCAIKAFSQTDNVELQKMADDDQNSRMKSDINWMILNKEDSLRRVRVFELLKENKVQTAKDYFNSGVVFQHGNDTIASGMAVKTFKKALELDPSLNRWWYAAAVDRDLMRKGEPQIYGTQFTKNKSTNGKWVRYKIDPTKVTDEERQYYAVETLAQQIEKERKMNLKTISSYYNSGNLADKTIKLIKQEFKKGTKSEYDISEEAVNEFGYNLLNQNKNEEALKVFKLNTELYPNGYNTYDSYGECLMKLGQKEKAIKAYKKSLALNPENGNAKQIINENK